MTKNVKARYDIEFKLMAVRLAESEQSVAAAARNLGICEQTLWKWRRAKREGRLNGTDSMLGNAEQIEIGRLRAELKVATMKCEILMKGHWMLCEPISAKCAFIQENCRTWPVSLMCEVLGVSPRGYRRHINRKARSCTRTRLSGDALPAQIRAIPAENKDNYRWFGLSKELLERGIRWVRSGRAR